MSLTTSPVVEPTNDAIQIQEPKTEANGADKASPEEIMKAAPASPDGSAGDDVEQAYPAEMQEKQLSPEEEIQAELKKLGLDAGAMGLDRFFDESKIRKWKAAPKEEGSFEELRWKVTMWFDGTWVRIFIFLIVMISVVLLGINTNKQVANENTSTGSDVLEVFVVIIFILEVVGKTFGLQKLYFKDAWNILDLAITVTSTCELIYRLLFPNTQGFGLHLLRVARSLRVLRFFRLSEELKELVTAFVLAFAKVIYVMIFLLLILYVFALIATLEIGMMEEGSPLLALKDDNGSLVRQWFGTVEISMVTLFQIMTGDSWVSQVSRTIATAKPDTWYFFLFFYMVAGLGVLNLFTAVIIEQLQLIREEAQAEKEMEKEQVKANAIVAFCKLIETQVDQNSDGRLTAEELDAAIAQMQHKDAFKQEKRDLRLHAKITMKKLLAAGGALIEASDTGDVSIEEFKQVIHSIHDAASKGEVLDLQAQVLKINKKCDTMQMQMQELVTAFHNYTAQQAAQRNVVQEVPAQAGFFPFN